MVCKKQRAGCSPGKASQEPGWQRGGRAVSSPAQGHPTVPQQGEQGRSSDGNQGQSQPRQGLRPGQQVRLTNVAPARTKVEGLSFSAAPRWRRDPQKKYLTALCVQLPCTRSGLQPRQRAPGPGQSLQSPWGHAEPCCKISLGPPTFILFLCPWLWLRRQNTLWCLPDLTYETMQSQAESDAPRSGFAAASTARWPNQATTNGRERDVPKTFAPLWAYFNGFRHQKIIPILKCLHLLRIQNIICLWRRRSFT